jgi:hypothetical protein
LLADSRKRATWISRSLAYAEGVKPKDGRKNKSARKK